jgi:hypothetical protein
VSRKPLNLAGTPNLRDLLVEAARLGCGIENNPRTGEVRVTVPGAANRLNINSRRKDGGRAIIVALRRLQQEHRA